MHMHIPDFLGHGWRSGMLTAAVHYHVNPRDTTSFTSSSTSHLCAMWCVAGLFGRSQPDENDMSIEGCAASIARAQMLAQRVRADLLLRLGVPRIDGELPVVIARFSARCGIVLRGSSDAVRSEAGGELVRIAPISDLRAIKKKVEECPVGQQHDAWQEALLAVATPTLDTISKYHEHAVPPSAAGYNGDYRDVREGDVKDDDYLPTNDS